MLIEQLGRLRGLGNALMRTGTKTPAQHDLMTKAYAFAEAHEANIERALQRSSDTLQALQLRQLVTLRLEELTEREREVMQWLLQGLRNKQTADRLGISEVTVKVHRHRMMEKMAAGSLPELIAMLDRLGVPRTDPGMSQGPEGG